MTIPEITFRRGHASTYAAFRQAVAAAAERGLTLLSTEWYGTGHPYLFRCARNHEFSRLGTLVLRGTPSCLQCRQENVLQRFQDVLRERGFTCEEGIYLGQNARQHFVCASGHRWETLSRKILEGHGCPRCRAQRTAERLTFTDGLERLHAAAAARGGKCLADTYVGMAASYLWECEQGHRWKGGGNKTISGSWCGVCAARHNGDARRRADGMARLKATAATRGGQCLDEVYVGTNEKYRFCCAQGHEWQARGHLVLRGSWCRLCAYEKTRRTIEQMRELAQERGGRCLSEAYGGNKVKLTWECSLGHVWNASPDNIVSRGAWCPNCFRLRITRDPALRRRYDAND